jgi:hypothetical protein
MNLADSFDLISGCLKSGMRKDNKKDFVYCDRKMAIFNEMSNF